MAEMDENDTPAARRGLTRGMRIALIAVGAVVVAGMIVSFSLLSGRAPEPGAAGATASTGAAANSTGSASGAPGGSTRSPGPLPQATPTSGSEVLPPTAKPTTTLPPVPKPSALISAPFPRSASRSGALVAGYPTKVMGPVPASAVAFSAISTSRGGMQVTLVARTTTTRAVIRKHYATLWSSLGLHPQTTATKTLVYRGPTETLALTFDSTGTGDRYTVFGSFRAR